MSGTCFLVFLLACDSVAHEPQNVAVLRLDKDFQLIGKLHVPLGQVLSIEGVALEGRFKGFEGGPNLRVQKIGHTYCQEDIQIVVKPFFRDWGEKVTVGGEALPKLEFGRTYRMEGYETGGYVGNPSEIFRRGAIPVQTTDHYFQTRFEVIKAMETEPIVYAPWMFPGRKALLHGVAKTNDGHAVMQGPDWTIVVTRRQAWPEDIEGKKIETFGMYNPDSTWKDQPNRVPKSFDLGLKQAYRGWLGRQ